MEAYVLFTQAILKNYESECLMMRKISIVFVMMLAVMLFTSVEAYAHNEFWRGDPGEREEAIYVPTTIAPQIETINPLSPQALNRVTNTATAVQAVRNVLISMTSEELETGLLEMFAEQAIGRAASQTVSGSSIALNQTTIAPLQTTAINTRDAIYAMFREEGYTSRRDLSANVSFVSTNAQSTEILVEPSVNQAEVQHVRIRTPQYELAFPPNFTASEVTNAPLTVTVTTGNSYTVNFSRPVEDTLRLSVAPLQGDRSNQTLMNSARGPMVTRYNPATGLLDARIRASDTYVVVRNRVDFGDIQHLSSEMQEAIRILASQGVITGTGAEQFSPDNSINRAQVAALTMRMLGRLDPNADGNFVDVQRNDWFFGAAGSANRHGIMTGTEANRFSPTLVIPRDQLTVISARILSGEMGYRNPANPSQFLQVFADRNDFADWSLPYIALAARENMVIFRADGRFMPRASMTRGDVALALHRLYLRMW